MTIAWTPAMETGSRVFDDEQRRFLGRVNALLAAVTQERDRATIEKALRDVGSAALRYFARDEDCALRDQCTAVERGGTARAEFVAILARFRVDFEQRGADQAVGRSLEAGLGHWVERYVPGEGASNLPCVTVTRGL